MAMQAASPAAALSSAHVIGNAFVEQYYHILHESPELVYKFYQDSSVLSRPDSNGVMTSVTTMQAINDKILSLDYGNYKAEIKTADAQESYKGGVIVLVTGCLTGKDNVRKKFTQTFFLAPHYFVLNDVFRYVEESESLEVINSVTVNNGINNNNATMSPLPLDPEPICGPDHPPLELVATFQTEDLKSGCRRRNGGGGSGAVAVAGCKGRSVTVASLGSAKPSPELEASAPTGDSAPQSNDAHEEVEGYSIHVRNLPVNAMVAQLEEEFRKFGPIKRGGIQVRSNKQGFCFGSVEFESLISMQSAIKASPLTIGGRQAVVEEKRTTTRVGSSARGRYPSGRGGFRNDNFRSRGNFGGGGGGGRSFGRNELVYTQGKLILNVDGCSKGDPGQAGYGGLLRDETGSWIWGYYGKLGYCSSLEAELWAIYRGVTILFQKGTKDVVIESDSEQAINQLQEGPTPHSPYKALIKDVEFLLVCCNCSLGHTLRERNRVADRLANLGVAQDEHLVVLETPPEETSSLLIEDMIGCSVMRD